eukprot:TRINITY_DN8194_c0_g1_i34.p1 TRINITY_DN8194_c0_g1~~TRINITY_DN8194_c0_g1_i34.p1  ORF type:complete len:243 (-),score=59.87 TRINITY_DN8194_c0_g1_i34:17-745(-)
MHLREYTDSDIQQMLKDLHTHVVNLEKVSNQLGTKSDNADMRAKMKKEWSACSDGIRALINATTSGETGKTQQDQLTKEVATFEEIQKRIKKKEQQLYATLTASGGTGDRTSDGGDWGVDGGGGQMQMQDGFDQKQFERNKREIEKQHKEILQLEEDTREVFEMFKQMHIMVKEQESLVDNMAKSVEVAKDNAAGAEQELNAAEHYQKAARKKQWCLYGLIAEIGRAVQQECRDRSRMPSSA